jgi:hypothetical protein
MSHLVKKGCNLNDIAVLIDAALRLGWQIDQHAKAKFFSGYSELCDYVFSLTGELNDRGESIKYQIGVTQEGGKIQLHYDNAMNSREVLFGDEEDACTQRIIGKLKASYQIVQTRKFAQKKGYRLHEKVLENGKVVLRLGGVR